jgi:hypothetical protein
MQRCCKDALKNLSKDEKLKIEDIESFFNFTGLFCHGWG